MDNTEPRIPAVAVASGPHIYIYKNMRPYFKFTLPTLEIHPAEKELWTAASSASTSEGAGNNGGGGLDLASLLDGLQSLRAEIGDAKLTARTQRLLMINDRAEAQVNFTTFPTLVLISGLLFCGYGGSLKPKEYLFFTWQNYSAELPFIQHNLFLKK